MKHFFLIALMVVGISCGLFAISFAQITDANNPTSLNQYVQVFNNTGSSLNKGAPVVLVGTDVISTTADYISVQNAPDTNDTKVIGILVDTVENQAYGKVCTYGIVYGLFDSSGSPTQEVNVGVSATDGQLTSGGTGIGSVVETRSGYGLARIFVKHCR